MSIIENLVFGLACSAAIGLLFTKYLYTKRTEQRLFRDIHVKWLGRYQRSSLAFTSSRRYRYYMQAMNKLGIALYITLAIAIFMILRTIVP